MAKLVSSLCHDYLCITAYSLGETHKSILLLETLFAGLFVCFFFWGGGGGCARPFLKF